MSIRKKIKQLLNFEQKVVHTKSEEVLAQQVNIFYEQSKPGLIINVAVILVMSLFLEIVFNNAIYSYFAVGIILNAIATYLYIQFGSKMIKKNRSPVYRGNILSIFNLVSGLLWGLFFTVGLDLNNEILTYFSMFLVASMLTGAASFLSYYLLAYLAFTISMAAPLSVLLISSQSDTYILLGSLLPAAVIAGFGYARNLNKTAAESFQLRFEKEDLVKELILQKNEANSLRKDAENASIAKSKFLAAASHDLRQPLHALTFFSEALDEDKNDPKQKRLVENIKNSVNVMESLFNALLDISKLDAGIVQSNISDFSLDDFIQSIYNEFSDSNKNTDVCFEYLNSMPAGTTQVVIKTDATLLEVIVRNLISNAFRYTREGSIWIKFDIRGNSILLEVGDTGIGIPEDQLNKIFDEYYQLTNPDRDREKGLGLGLAIVKRLINILNLKIEVKSEIGLGSKFIVTIPQGDINNVKLKATTPSLKIKVFNSVNVLVIDDDKMVRESLSAILTKWGYQHRTVESTDEAETVILDEEFLPGAILADYQLKHGKTGIESILHIHKLVQSEIPAIIMTGDILPENLTEVKKSNFPVLYKPVKPIQLRQFLLRCEP